MEEGKKEDNWMEKAFLEHKEQRDQEIAEMNNRKKQSRRQALHLSKAMTQIKEATQTVGELSDFAFSSLNSDITTRDVTLEELAAELKANEERRKEEETICLRMVERKAMRMQRDRVVALILLIQLPR